MVATESFDINTDIAKLNTSNNCLNKPMYDGDTKICENTDWTDNEYRNNHHKNMNETNGLTEIQEFYKEKNVLITGVTGFLGKILVDKLLRSCPGIQTIYLLVRPKRGKDINTRIDELFDDPVFSRLKEEVPKFRHKIVFVAGDCEAAELGLTLSDRQLLVEKVNIIFHSAATVRFDEHLKVALLTNVKAPLYMLQLARDMKDLNALMHISTAFSNSFLSLIEERFYRCDADCEQLLKIMDEMTSNELDYLLPTILGPWPNTYTFTKALAEKHIRLNAGKLPICVFRPAIVTSTAKEPVKSWIDNMYGPTGVAAGIATGTLRTLHCFMSATAEIVPVDFVANCLIASAFNVHNTYKTCRPSEPPIFNYVSSVENRLSWKKFLYSNLNKLDECPFSNAVWYISLHLTSSRLLYNFYKVFLHLLPAAFTDAVLICAGRKPKMLKLYRKIHKFSAVINYFCTREIQFCNARTQALWQRVSDEDKKLFPFSMSEFDWDEYFLDYVLGLRRHLFKDDDDTIPQAKIKWQRLYYLHQIVKVVFYSMVMYVLWSFVCRIF